MRVFWDFIATRESLEQFASPYFEPRVSSSFISVPFLNWAIAICQPSQGFFSCNLFVWLSLQVRELFFEYNPAF